MKGRVAVFTAAAIALGMTTSASAEHATTARIVVRPVTQNGHAAADFRVTRQSGAVDCSTPYPSAGAISRNIEICAPSAAYAIACWKAATPHRVLCTRDASSDQLYSLPRSGKFAATNPPSRRSRAPLVLVLGNGWRCFVRDGGAWSSLKAHPDWYGTYSCNGNHDAVWSPAKAPHNGVDESHPVWTVRTAPISGNGPVTERTVRKAFFVGTKS